MPNVITYQQWTAAIVRVPPFKRSNELNKVTTSFEQYSITRTPQKLANLSDDFSKWEDATSPAVKTERTTLRDAFLNLEFTLSQATANPITSSTSVRPVGWTFRAWTAVAYPWTRPVVTQELPAFTSTELNRINEALRRARLACEIARDAMIKVKDRAPGPPATVQEQTYVDYFGPFNNTRVQKVLDNFRLLAMAFQAGPIVVDVRNTEYGKGCYAACFRHNLAVRDPKGVMSLSGGVEMFMGRSFFKGGGYEASTDNTVGTLVHEFAHGVLNAVDAPPVENGAWKLTPDHLGDPTHADYGSSPENSVQASTPDMDKALAAFAPDIAIRNADCYGQFARTCLGNASK